MRPGGAWGDPTYMFAQFGGRPGFFSSDKLGLPAVPGRADGAAGDQGAIAHRDQRRRSRRFLPTTDAEIHDAGCCLSLRRQTPLEARIEETIETPDWKREKITFNGAGGERAIAYLYLPHHVRRPLQVLHFVPAGDVHFGDAVR